MTKLRNKLSESSTLDEARRFYRPICGERERLGFILVFPSFSFNDPKIEHGTWKWVELGKEMLNAKQVEEFDDSLEIPLDPKLHLIFRKLARSMEVEDTYFDRIYPEIIQSKSKLHWTPIPVVDRAVELLTQNQPGIKIMDAGSGVGKFCMVGAILSRARFFGVEHRPHFVQLCQKLIQHYRIPRVTFLMQDLADLDWTQFQGIYLYNPFQEYKTRYQKIDATMPLEAGDFDRYVNFTREKLKQMPFGTRVVTYHGFGGRFPSSYVRTSQEFCYRGVLECWKKG